MAGRDYEQRGLAGRIWGFVSQPAVLGLALLGAGLLLAVAPMATPGAEWTGRWWIEPFRQPGVARAAFAILAGVTVLGAAAVAGRVERSTLAGWSGIALAAAGVAVALGHWWSLQDRVPPTRVTMPVGQTVESFEATLDGKAVDVMFSLRVQAAQVRHSPTSFDMKISQAGGEVVDEFRLAPGQSMVVGDYRLTAVGLERKSDSRRAILSSSRPRTITVGAWTGQTFQVSPDGEEYTLLDVTKNFMGALGPAAKVSHPELGEFWVFQRAEEAEPSPSFDHDLRLEGLERAPAPVLLVAPATPIWPVTLAGALVVLGLTGALFFPNGGPLASAAERWEDGSANASEDETSGGRG